MILGGDQGIRRQFISTLRQTVPGLRVLWLPNKNDAIQGIDASGSQRPINWDSTPTITKQGHGYLQTFNGTTNFGLSPDTADLTFGNGVLDQPFSIMALANVTSSAADRIIASKWTVAGGLREWFLNVTATTNLLSLSLFDETAAKQPIISSNAAITTGSVHLFASTYDGTGGATAGNGVFLYQDAVVIANTPVNQALYVAMADKAAGLQVSGLSAGATVPFQGSLGMVVVAAGVISPTLQLAIKAQVNNYFGLAL